MKSEYPHSLNCHVKIITASEKRMSDVVYNSRARALSDFRNCVPGALVLSRDERTEKKDLKKNKQQKCKGKKSGEILLGGPNSPLRFTT